MFHCFDVFLGRFCGFGVGVVEFAAPCEEPDGVSPHRGTQSG